MAPADTPVPGATGIFDATLVPPRREVPPHIFQANYVRLQKASLIAATASALAAVGSILRALLTWVWPSCSGTIEIAATLVIVVIVAVALVAIVQGSRVMRQLSALMLMHHGRPEDTTAEIEELLRAATKEAKEAHREIQAARREVDKLLRKGRAKTMRRRVQEQWDTFEAAAIPPTASSEQRRDMRRAFFGGANSLFHILLRDVSDSPEQTPEDDALGDEIDAEFKEFLDDLKRGKA